VFQTGHPDKPDTQINQTCHPDKPDTQTGHPDKPYESSLQTETSSKICKAAQKFPLEAKKKRLPWKGGIVHMGKLSIGRVSEEK